MSIYSISQEQFDKLNKSLSEALGMEYHFIVAGNQLFEYTNSSRGGATKGTTGYKYTEEQRKNISNGLKGKPNSWLGKHHSEQGKKNISIAKKGTKWPEEGKEERLKALQIRNKNRVISEETRQKMKEKALMRESLKRQKLGN